MHLQTPVTYSFLILCILVSVPSALFPTYFDVFSGELPHAYWWQNFSIAFQHGAKAMPLAILGHLALNMVLLLTCGRFVEKLLGSPKFLMLTLVAWLGFVMTEWLLGIWVNGSSGIIWAYSPFLLLPIQWAKQDPNFNIQAEQARVLLIVMWGLITIAMGFVPLLFNPNHKLWYTFVFGNMFHASAVAIGFVFYFIWRKRIAKSNRLNIL